jgi:hypothetical protein
MHRLARAIVRLLLPAREAPAPTETVKHSDERSTESAGGRQQNEVALPSVPLNWSSDGSPDGSSWQEREGLPTTLWRARDGLTAQVWCDPLRRERICLSTLACCRQRASAVSVTRPQRPLPPTPSELFDAVSDMLETIGAAGLTPTLVLIEPAEQFEIWQRWLAGQAPPLGPHQRETMTGKQWAQIMALPFLDRRPYGLELATRLAALLRSAGHQLAYGHRDYCGHGMRAASGSYCLEVYEDGLPSRRVASWPDERSFIDALASWSDYICSGCDPDASIFAAESEFELNNQRITRARIEEYLRASSG